MRADEVFSAKKIVVAERVDARKVSIDAKAALRLLRDADRIMVTKGKNVVGLDPRTTPDAEMESLVIGRTGNLRAPTVRVGRTYAVGFSPEMLAQVLKF